MDFYSGDVICQTEQQAAVRAFFEGLGATLVEVLDGRVRVVTALTTIDVLNLNLARLRSTVSGIQISRFTIWEPEEDRS